VFQWNNHSLFGLPYFHRFVVHTTAPTGDFDQRDASNPGGNVWSIAPYYSQTLWFLPYLDLEISFRHQWRNVTKNPDPDIQPGRLYYVNYAASYGLTQNFRGEYTAMPSSSSLTISRAAIGSLIAKSV
jgi:hypothetical protein